MNGGVTISIATAYGIEFSSGLISVARARRGKSGSNVELLAQRINPSGTQWKELAAAISAEQKNGAALVNLLAPAQDTFIRTVEAPFASARKARAVFPSLLDVELPFPLEQCAYEFVRIQQSEPARVRALALAMPLDRLQKLTDDFSTASGLDPEYIEPEALALWRMAGLDRKTPSSHSMVVLHLSTDRTVAVVGNNGSPVTSFSARTPWNAAEGDAAQEKLKNRLQQFLAGALRDPESGRSDFVVTGPLVTSAGEHARETLAVESSHWHVLSAHDAEPVCALALSCLQPDDWSANLRGGQRVHPNLTRLRNRARHKNVHLIIAAAVILMAVNWVAARVVKQSDARAQQQLNRIAREVSGAAYVERGQELLRVTQSLASASERDQPLKQWTSPAVYHLFARAMQLAYDRKIIIESISVRANGAILRGAGPDWSDAEVFAGAFSERGWKAEIERNDAGSDELVHFVVRAQP